ncbi:3'-5' exoribonuclease YhaM family protein [Lachnospira pectinoschiza]|uniref:3'-5' exoribonuclease n=1 Tax=Lachnospira pectinoschiza TaxID=28052 RepID=A0A1G9XPZ5_9FIRM|nr:HD domain-containing protein [Lachnospira pectinoschiza]SDM98847.1 3'-5' exoribonuclease [Lachnospira pectinoschiza]
MRYIETLKDGERISEVYYVKQKQIALTRTNKEYGNVILADKTGQIDTKIWDLNSGGIQEFEVGDFVDVSGQISSYNGSLQFKVERIRVANEDEYVISDYVPSSRYDVEDMFKELLGFVDSVKNEYLKQLLDSFFRKDENFVKAFKNTSAAKTVHHGFTGGLLEHSLSVTRLCDKMAANYDYLNRDLLISAAMLHDAGKTKELSEFPKNDYTDEGNFLGHIVIGYEMVMDKIKTIEGFPEMLKLEIGHCILSHHGELEYGSPKKPSIAEAIALSMADNIDAKLETLREALDAKDTNDWIGFNRWLDANVRRTI